MTRYPKRAKIWANSHPIGPAPTITSMRVAAPDEGLQRG